jgi:hypothetical protein
VPIVNVDLGISELLRLVDGIVSRRAERKRQVVQDVLDDVEAVVAVVKGLDKLFTDILSQFASRRVVEDDTALADLVEETRKFLFGRDVLPVFDQRLAAIRKATRSKAKQLQRLRMLLKHISDALDSYRRSLDQEMGPATAPGRLGRVFSHAYARVNGADLPPSRIREEADLTLRQHDFALSERIYKISGELTQAARG